MNFPRSTGNFTIPIACAGALHWSTSFRLKPVASLASARNPVRSPPLRELKFHIFIGFSVRNFSPDRLHKCLEYTAMLSNKRNLDSTRIYR